MTPFRISEAVFIESAYISGEAKMSVSTKGYDKAGRGPATVEALIGVPGGMFVKHRGAWNFCPWANVKSASLVDVPAEVIATAEGDLPARKPLTAEEASKIAAELKASILPAKYEHDELPEHERKARAGKVEVVSVPVVVTADAEPSTTYSAPPERDAMGVLKSLQPSTGPMLICGACNSRFVQGSNHVCTKPDDLI